MEEDEIESYFFETNEEFLEKKVFILIIYDICNNKKRVKFANVLSGYGTRVQKSAFEAVLTKKKYKELLDKIPRYIDKTEDSVKIYQIQGKGQVLSWGIEQEILQEDIIIV